MTNNIPAVKNSTAALREQFTHNQVSPTAGGGKAFLRFDAKRTGEWLFGQEGEGCTGDIVAIDISTLEHGYILWHDRKANRKMVPLNQPLPQPQEPVHYKDAKGKPQTDEANEARAFEGAFDDGTGFVYEASSFGGRKAIDAFLKELFMRAQGGSDYIFPKVALESNSYDHASYGLVYEPVIAAVSWHDEEGNPEPAADAKLDAPAPEAESEAEAPAQDAAPQRRRRRPAA